MYGGISNPGIGRHPPRLQRDLDTSTRCNSCHALASRIPADHQSASEVAVPHERGNVDQGHRRFRSWGVEVVDLSQDPDPGTETYPP